MVKKKKKIAPQDQNAIALNLPLKKKSLKEIPLTGLGAADYCTTIRGFIAWNWDSQAIVWRTDEQNNFYLY